MPSLRAKFIEIFKRLYLSILRITFFLIRACVRQIDQRVLFITSFSDSGTLLQQEFFHAGFLVREIKPTNFNIISQLYNISRASIIVVDNYYYPFAILPLARKKVVQLWHANGAIKKFGLASPKNLSIGPSALKRFEAVYSNVNFIPVGSDKMLSFLTSAFNFVEDHKFVKTGFPRSDALFHSSYLEIVSNIKSRYPILNEKVVILYLPTFRDSDCGNEEQVRFLKQLSCSLPSNFLVCYHFHQEFYKQHHASDFKDALNILSSELIYFYELSNLIITDYSSVIFEACLRNKPLAFYLYDYDKYRCTQGLFLSKSELPGFCSSDSATMLRYITSGKYDSTKTHAFSREWNQYNKGSSCKDLIAVLSK